MLIIIASVGLPPWMELVEKSSLVGNLVARYWKASMSTINWTVTLGLYNIMESITLACLNTIRGMAKVDF